MVVRVRVRVASVAQNPWGSVSTPATSRAAVRARAMRTAFWKNTDRRPAWPRTRCHHSIGARALAYQKRPGVIRTAACLPCTARSAAVAMASAASAISRAAACRRSTAGGKSGVRAVAAGKPPMGSGSAGTLVPVAAGPPGAQSLAVAGSPTATGPADTADRRARALRSSSYGASGERPVPRQVAVAVASRATARSTAVTSGPGCPSGAAGSCARRLSRVRVARPVWARARSRTPGPAGRSASGTVRDRSDRPVSQAVRMSGSVRAYGGAARRVAQCAAVCAAWVARSR